MVRGEDGLFWLRSFESPQDYISSSGKPCPLAPGSLGLWPEAGLAFPRVPGPQPSESFSALEAGHPIPPEQHTQMEPPPPLCLGSREGGREQEGLETGSG